MSHIFLNANHRTAPERNFDDVKMPFLILTIYFSGFVYVHTIVKVKLLVVPEDMKLADT